MELIYLVNPIGQNVAIVVKGATCSLGEAVVDKLLSWDVNVVATEESHFIRNASLLEYSNSQLLDEGEGFSVSFDLSEADLIIGKDLIISDLLPSRRDKWLTDDVEIWITDLLDKDSTTYQGPERYWLCVLDAAEAIANFCRNEIRVKNMHMCGRRKWESKDSLAELKMLLTRTIQGISGRFTSDTLFGHSIAGMEAKPIVLLSEKRPDLEPLHNQLIAIGTDGWRPLIPFRTAMMNLLAGILVQNP